LVEISLYEFKDHKEFHVFYLWSTGRDELIIESYYFVAENLFYYFSRGMKLCTRWCFHVEGSWELILPACELMTSLDHQTKQINVKYVQNIAGCWVNRKEEIKWKDWRKKIIIFYNFFHFFNRNILSLEMIICFVNFAVSSFRKLT